MSLSLAGVVNQTMAHIHVGAPGSSGPAVVTLPLGSFTNLVLSLDSATVALLLAGNTYVNVHTAQNPAGEIRGQIGFPGYATTSYLSGAQQPSPVSSPASGVGNVVITGPTTVNVSLTIVGLVNNQTGAHLHIGGVPGTRYLQRVTLSSVVWLCGCSLTLVRFSAPCVLCVQLLEPTGQ
jgi:hypothetical protein